MDDSNPFVSNEVVDIDQETAAALEQGILAAEEGRCLPSSEVRALISVWIANFSARDEFPQ